MKKITILIIASFFLTALSSFKSLPILSVSENPQDQKQQFHVPDNIKLILDNYCLQCHGTDGSGKAKLKWNFDKMSDMKVSKMISKLSKINNELEESKMPPKKYLKKHPEKKIPADDKQMLMEWAEGLAQSFMAE